MTDWVTITDEQIDPESPVTSELMTALRDNLSAYAEQNAGAPFGNIAYNAQEFLTGGNWVKPLDALATDRVVVWIVAGGGSGAANDNQDAQISPFATTGGQGGSGGYYAYTMSDLLSTEPVTIGAGGAAVLNASVATNGNVGGLSTFRAAFTYGEIRANGGSGGVSSTFFSPAVEASFQNGPLAVDRNNLPNGAGGKPGNGTDTIPVAAVYGGGAGGGYYEIGSSTFVLRGGISTFAGNGGIAAALEETGPDGSFPGGGGTAGVGIANSGNVSSGAGADGYGLILCFRENGFL